jgi:tRNA threonylcarbamoyladenosine biosynthesis protein TsaE
MISFISESQQDTIDLGRKIARLLKPGCVIALSGNLGAGKTTFVKGIGQGLGIAKKQVNSPSYVLIREYKGLKTDLFHCDLYRLDNLEQISFLGIEDYFDQNGIFVIEWGKKASGLLPDQYLDINITVLNRQKRRFKIKAHGKDYQPLIDKLNNLKCKRQKSEVQFKN